MSRSRSISISTLLRTNILSAFLLLALSGFLCSSSAMARGGKPPPPPPPPPPGPVVLNDILASFVGSHINSGPQACTPQGEATTASGTLACDSGPPAIQINTFGIGSLTTGKKSVAICKSFSVIGPVGTVGFSGNPDNFTVTYTGDCNSAQGCTVAIGMTLTGNIAALTGGVADHANITFAGLVTNAGSSNPFAGERDIDIDQFVLNFLKPTGASAASCFWGVSTENVFMSQPVVP